MAPRIIPLGNDGGSCWVFYVRRECIFHKLNSFLTFEPISVAVNIISLICWPQTIRPNSRLIPQSSSTFISGENNWIPIKEQMLIFSLFGTQSFFLLMKINSRFTSQSGPVTILHHTGDIQLHMLPAAALAWRWRLRHSGRPAGPQRR